ncbi:sugar transporter ERD6-like 6 isoform X2 [Cryptomeria japonica]|uniref:sugar transporter ERD6-like 6 isoform X2 n=1 Tax=Cryptomeria japonica TaxID=3369 RepID=UPI0025AC8304|nr:sugar transporter ERD6-like 6 isoform X2 [Cryptomeria japonica]
MSFSGDLVNAEDGKRKGLDGDLENDEDVKTPLIHQTNSWYSSSFRGIERGGSSNQVPGTTAEESSVNAILFTLIVALGPLQYGFTNGYSSPTESSIMKDLNLTISEFSLFGSLSNAGAMIGAMVCGLLADYIGRKGALVAASIPNILGWIAICLAEDSSILYLGRILTGLGVGIISFTVPVYIAEISPKHLRGGLGTINMLSITIGIFVVYLLGMFISWRHLAIAGAVPCSLLVLGLFLIPEAPRWLAKIGKDLDFEASLQVLRGLDSDVSIEATEIRSAMELNRQEPNIKLSELCQRRYAFPLTIGIGLLVLQQLTGISGIMFYNTSIFKAAGISDAEVASLGLAGVQVLMTGIIAWLMDKAGRRILLMISSAGMAASLFLIGIAFYLKSHIPADTYLASILALIGLLACIISFSLGMGAIPWIIMSEILPINVKGIAGSVATLANWSLSWAVTMSINLLLEWSKTGTFMLYALFSALTLTFVVLFVPETKGRTLEEIEASHR